MNEIDIQKSVKALRRYNSVARRTNKKATWENRTPDNKLKKWGIQLSNGMSWRFYWDEGNRYYLDFFSKTRVYTDEIPYSIFVAFYNFLVHGIQLPSKNIHNIEPEDPRTSLAFMETGAEV